MEWWQIYLLTRIGPLQFFCWLLFAVGSVGVLLAWVYTAIDVQFPMLKDEYAAAIALRKIIRKAVFPVVIISGLGCVLVPSDKDVAIIMAGHWVSHNEEMKKIPDNVAKTINSFLERHQK